MPAREEIVLLPGILRGLGHEVECRVRATRVALSGPAGVALAVAYCKYEIQDVRKLPDGRYKLYINSEIIPMRLHEGLWYADGIS